ncbi:CpaD family pilus assembly protein [Novosphingobium sp. Leaf2]|uniref:CpaD family pilus assembly protein n=1 Tax=Novosphingobium sp. Leaf2 TaxID=1735670 RepID=UPI00070156B9|nr:CpaD family pilus assembly protein [Novosphingobium sp. Leaf2]KQM20620.1 pilus assembly protein CpaD [Novosphingobium sp. Leaf2]
MFNHNRGRKALASTALTAGLALALSACGGIPTNRSMYSVHQPVVEKVQYAMDVTTSGSGLAYGEQSRLADWLEALRPRYGDKVYLDDPASSPATRSAVEAVAARYGVLLGDGVPETADMIPAGTARIIISRAKASVPGCPDWSAKNDFNPNNATSSNYGCAVNSNLAAMMANPEDLLHGNDDTGNTVRTSNKAIQAWREASPTGKGNIVSGTSTKGN